MVVEHVHGTNDTWTRSLCQRRRNRLEVTTMSFYLHSLCAENEALSSSAYSNRHLCSVVVVVLLPLLHSSNQLLDVEVFTVQPLLVVDHTSLVARKNFFETDKSSRSRTNNETIMVIKAMEKAVRLPSTPGSFGEMEAEHDVPLVHHSSQHIDVENPPPTPPAAASATVVNRHRIDSTPEDRSTTSDDFLTENEQLRQKIDDLQMEVYTLRKYYDRSIKLNKGVSSSHPKHGIVLELPRAMRLPFPSTSLQARNMVPKDHQSLDTDDDQSTIEPTMDWDLHESASGLKKRYSLPLQQPKPARRRPPMKTESISSDDGSFSCSDSEGGPIDEEEGGMNMERRPLVSSNNETRRPSSKIVLAEETFWHSVSDRAGWLVGLLMMQSMSSFILARNEALLQEHLVIVRFLTMLVGAGGNAGNQASVRGECRCDCCCLVCFVALRCVASRIHELIAFSHTLSHTMFVIMQ